MKINNENVMIHNQKTSKPLLEGLKKGFCANLLFVATTRNYHSKFFLLFFRSRHCLSTVLNKKITLTSNNDYKVKTVLALWSF